MSDTRATDSSSEPPWTKPSRLELEIPRQPQVLQTGAAAFRGAIAELQSRISSRNVNDWVVTGCGDGLFAGTCAEVWFARLAGRRLRAIPAMQLSRECYPSLGPDSVVVAVSHSGTTARVLEAARAAQSRGSYVVALTANPDSALARTADLWIDNTVRDEQSNCRTASFQAVALFFRMLAEAVAGVRSESATPPLDRLAAYVVEAREQVGKLNAAELAGEHWIFTGSGLGLAVAEYGNAKMYEAATLAAHCVELEQFIHCEIFTVRSDTTIVLIAPHGRASSRARELAKGLRTLGATTIAVTDDSELAALCTHAFTLPAGLAENDQPFFAVAPLQWLALRLAYARDDDPDLVRNKWVNRPLIDHSEQWDSATYQKIVTVAAPARA